MSKKAHFSFEKPEAPLNPFAEAATAHRWCPIDKLEPHFVRFLFSDLAEYRSASKVMNGKVHIHRELIQKHTSYDVAWGDLADDQEP